MSRLVWMLLIVLFPTTAHAAVHWEKKGEGGFSVSLEVSHEVVPIDQILQLQVTVTYPKGYQWDREAFTRRLLASVNGISNHFELSGWNVSSEKSAGEGVLTQTATYQFEPLIAGDYYLNFLTIPFKPLVKDQGKPVDLVLDYFPLKVMLPIEEIPDLLDLAAPLLPLSQEPLITMNDANKQAWFDGHLAEQNRLLYGEKTFPLGPWLSGIALTALALLLWRPVRMGIAYLKRRRKEKREDPKKEALQNLSGLKKTQAKALEHPEEYYIYLSDILRHYIEDRYQIPAKHQTTQEFLAAVAKNPPFGKTSQLLLTEFLKSADMVKFAGYPPTLQECEQALLAAQQFVEKN